MSIRIPPRKKLIPIPRPNAMFIMPWAFPRSEAGNVWVNSALSLARTIADPNPVTTLAATNWNRSCDIADNIRPIGTIIAPERYMRFLPNTSDIRDKGSRGTVTPITKARFTQTMRLALVWKSSIMSGAPILTILRFMIDRNPLPATTRNSTHLYWNLLNEVRG